MDDGRVVDLRVGDVIQVRPGVDAHYVYDPGFVEVSYFWSEQGALPAYLSDGLSQG